MPRGPLGGRRPGAMSILRLSIREIPVPTGDDTGVFPMSIIRESATDEEMLDDMAERTGIDRDRFSVDRSSSFTRGLGTTTVWDINLEVDGLRPEQVEDAVQVLSSAGYEFERVTFE